VALLLVRLPRERPVHARSCFTRTGTQVERERIFREAARIVAAEFQRPLTAEEVARRVAVSPRHLRRVFSEVYETSFRSYLAQVRMLRAAELVACSDLPIGEIARRVGYREPSQFTKAFKRAHGATPSDARRGC